VGGVEEITEKVNIYKRKCVLTITNMCSVTYTITIFSNFSTCSVNQTTISINHVSGMVILQFQNPVVVLCFVTDFLKRIGTEI